MEEERTELTPEEALAQREREISARETRVRALELLSERGLSPKLIGILDLSSEENCVTSLDAVESVLRGEVKAQVDRRLSEKRLTLPGVSAKDEDSMSDREYYLSKGIRW